MQNKLFTIMVIISSKAQSRWLSKSHARMQIWEDIRDASEDEEVGR